MQRTLPLTPDDLEEATGALDAIDRAEDALRDLHERLKRKEDEGRSGRARIAISRLGEARAIIAHAFR